MKEFHDLADFSNDQVDELLKLAARLEEALIDQGVKEWEYPCILELEFPADPKGGRDQVRILDLVIEHWVVVD